MGVLNQFNGLGDLEVKTNTKKLFNIMIDR